MAYTIFCVIYIYIFGVHCIHIVKDYELKSLDLVEILYSDAVTKAVLSVWELLLEWQLDSNSNVTMEIISSTKTKAGRINQ